MFGETMQASETISLVAAALVALAVSYVIARIGSGRDYLPDVPNARSSHAEMTPRSGGLAIIGSWIFALLGLSLLLTAAAAVETMVIVAAFGFVTVLAGFIDDQFSLSPPIKLLGQIIIATGFVFVIGGFSVFPVPFFGDTVLGGWGTFLTILWIVGFMNVFNFMDGAHGIAASSALLLLSVMSVAAALLGAIIPAIISILLAFGLAGFFRINFPRGILFMGDNGSQSVGFLIAALSVLIVNETNISVSVLFVPTAIFAFLFDVSFTLGHRIVRRQPIFTAHREHLYQLLLRQGFSHVKVTVLYTSLTAFCICASVLMLQLAPEWQWLVPLALATFFIIPAVLLYRKCEQAGFFGEIEQTEYVNVESEMGDLNPRVITVE